MQRLTCDVHALPADAVTLDVLARLRLAAARVGLELRLCEASPELWGLIAFTGLDEVLRVEPERKAEEREQRLGVQEEGELRDAPA
jgi:anti-anti-sigma regulatory factor